VAKLVLLRLNNTHILQELPPGTIFYPHYFHGEVDTWETNPDTHLVHDVVNPIALYTHGAAKHVGDGKTSDQVPIAHRRTYHTKN
jgi:hypothetical protein